MGFSDWVFDRDRFWHYYGTTEGLSWSRSRIGSLLVLSAACFWLMGYVEEHGLRPLIARDMGPGYWQSPLNLPDKSLGVTPGLLWQQIDEMGRGAGKKGYILRNILEVMPISVLYLYTAGTMLVALCREAGVSEEHYMSMRRWAPLYFLGEVAENSLWAYIVFQYPARPARLAWVANIGHMVKIIGGLGYLASVAWVVFVFFLNNGAGDPGEAEERFAAHTQMAGADSKNSRRARRAAAARYSSSSGRGSSPDSESDSDSERSDSNRAVRRSSSSRSAGGSTDDYDSYDSYDSYDGYESYDSSGGSFSEGERPGLRSRRPREGQTNASGSPPPRESKKSQ